MTGYLSSSTFFLRWKFIYICVTLSLFFFRDSPIRNKYLSVHGGETESLWLDAFFVEYYDRYFSLIGHRIGSFHRPLHRREGIPRRWILFCIGGKRRKGRWSVNLLRSGDEFAAPSEQNDRHLDGPVATARRSRPGRLWRPSRRTAFFFGHLIIKNRFGPNCFLSISLSFYYFSLLPSTLPLFCDWVLFFINPPPSSSL